MCGDKCTGGVLLQGAVITPRSAHLQASRWKTAFELVSITELWSRASGSAVQMTPCMFGSSAFTHTQLSVFLFLWGPSIDIIITADRLRYTLLIFAQKIIKSLISLGGYPSVPTMLKKNRIFLSLWHLVPISNTRYTHTLTHTFMLVLFLFSACFHFFSLFTFTPISTFLIVISPSSPLLSNPLYPFLSLIDFSSFFTFFFIPHSPPLATLLHFFFGSTRPRLLYVRLFLSMLFLQSSSSLYFLNSHHIFSFFPYFFSVFRVISFPTLSGPSINSSLNKKKMSRIRADLISHHGTLWSFFRSSDHPSLVGFAVMSRSVRLVISLQ